jgi:uncharacterized protein YcbK (DUF882 family)
MDNAFMNKLVELRECVGFPLVVSSAYRCPEHNKKVSDTGERGPHTTGKAIDIAIHGCNATYLVVKAWEKGFTGFGINQKGSIESRFIHLDTLEPPDYPRPTIWSY